MQRLRHVRDVLAFANESSEAAIRITTATLNMEEASPLADDVAAALETHAGTYSA